VFLSYAFQVVDMAEGIAFPLPVVIDGTPEAAARVPERFRSQAVSILCESSRTNCIEGDESLRRGSLSASVSRAPERRTCAA